MTPELTIIIKTFERMDSLECLLDSVEKMGFPYPIAIADDSRAPYRKKILDRFPGLPIEYIELPFDVGLSAGRNILLNTVGTEFFLLCDDDFYLDERADIPRAMDLLKEKDLDILGGLFYNYRTVVYPWDRFLRTLDTHLTRGRRWNFIGQMQLKERTLSIRTKLYSFPEFARVDFCHNFFIGRTEAVKKIGGWNEELKLDEHLAFFLRAKDHGLRVGFSNCFGTRHYPIRNKNYASFRFRGGIPTTLHLLDIHKRTNIFDNGETSIETLTPVGIKREFQFANSPRGWWRKLCRSLGRS